MHAPLHVMWGYCDSVVACDRCALPLREAMSEVVLETFLGGWRDSMGTSVGDAARAPCAHVHSARPFHRFFVLGKSMVSLRVLGVFMKAVQHRSLAEMHG